MKRITIYFVLVFLGIALPVFSAEEPNFVSVDGKAIPNPKSQSNATPESNEIDKLIDKLNSCVVGVEHCGAFNSFGVSLWGLIIESTLFTTGDGKRIKSSVDIDGNIVSLRLDADTAVVVFNFFLVKDGYALLNGASISTRGKAARQMNSMYGATGTAADALAASAMLSSFREDLHKDPNVTKEDIEAAKAKARKMISGDSSINIEADYVDLSSGPYKLPLNGTIEDVLNWCKENGIEVAQPIEKLPLFRTIDVTVDDYTYQCQDDITKNLFKLRIKPSNSMGNEGVVEITVFFHKEGADVWKSYATVFRYSMSYLNDAQGRLGTLSEILDEKYGKAELIPINTDDRGIGSEIFKLTEIKSGHESACVWRRNILLFGRVKLSDDGMFILMPGEGFDLMYYYPDSAKQIIRKYDEAVEEWKKTYQERANKRKGAAKKMMSENF